MSEAIKSSRDRPFGPFERTLAFRYLRAKREHGGVALISVISLVGIMLAVTALVVVMSIMNGFRSELIDRVLGASSHMKILVSDWSDVQTDDFIKDLQRLTGIDDAYPVVEGQALATHNGLSGGVLVRGMEPGTVRRLTFIQEDMRRGSAETFGAGDKGGNEVLIGEGLAVRIGAFPGDPITLISPNGARTAFGVSPARKTYTNAGVFRTGTINQLDEVLVLMPIEQAQLYFRVSDRYDAIEIKLTNPEATEAMKAVIANILPQPAYVYSWQDENKSFMGALEVERSMMRLIFLILVTITSLNIITGVVMLVKNKGRDIAILRTIGASRGTITRVFVMVGGILGILGTVTGLGLGLLVCWKIAEIQAFLSWVLQTPVFDPEVYGLPHLPAKIDWQEVIVASIWAFLMSVVVTIWPAWRAAKMDPVEALRFE